MRKDICALLLFGADKIQGTAELITYVRATQCRYNTILISASDLDQDGIMTVWINGV